MAEKFDGKQFGNDVANALASLSHAKSERESLGVHSTRYFEKPLQGMIGGPYQKEWTFQKGCLADEELQQGSCLVVKMKTEQGHQFIQLSKTPTREQMHRILQSYQQLGVVMKSNVGKPGEYLLTVQRENEQQPDKLCYLDAADVKDVMLQIGNEFQLGNNQERNRYVKVDGQIESVIALKTTN